MRQTIMLFLMTLLLILNGCGSDDSETTPGDNEANASEGSEQVTMGPGCYSGPPNHMCDCDVTESECASPQIWTDRCPCGANEVDHNTTDSAGEGGATSDQGMGGTEGNACYSPRSHECDCESTEESCSESGGIWTDMCPCDGSEDEHSDGDHSQDHNDMGDEHDNNQMSDSGAMADGGSGCYGGPPTHMCDCETTEAACTEGGGIWTDRCSCD